MTNNKGKKDPKKKVQPQTEAERIAELCKRALEESEAQLKRAEEMSKVIDELEKHMNIENRQQKSSYKPEFSGLDIHPDCVDQFFTYCLN